MGASQKQKRKSLANGAVKDFEPSLVPRFTLACSVQGSLGSIRVGHSRSPTRPGECQNCRASTNHGSLARFGEYDFQLQDILFKISVTFCFPLYNLHYPQLIDYTVYHFEISHKPGALSQIISGLQR